MFCLVHYEHSSVPKNFITLECGVSGLTKAEIIGTFNGVPVAAAASYSRSGIGYVTVKCGSAVNTTLTMGKFITF